MVKYIASHFDGIDKEYINQLSKSKIVENWAYVNKDYIVTSKEILTINDFISNDEYSDFHVIVPYDVNYVNITRKIALEGITKCSILMPCNGEFKLIDINYETMKTLKNQRL